MIPLTLGLHTVAAVVWVGGMFFAHMALRPVLAGLAPAERLKLWDGILPRFFFWVWVSIATLLVTGYGVIVWGYGGFVGLAMHINIMQGIGLLMMLLYSWLYFVPYREFRRAMTAGDFPAAGAAQARIRRVISVNLPLGLITSAVGATGGFWG